MENMFNILKIITKSKEERLANHQITPPCVFFGVLYIAVDWNLFFWYPKILTNPINVSSVFFCLAIWETHGID
jgi:hypothetical protein